MSINKFLRKAAKAKGKPHWCVEHQQWEAKPHDEKSLEKDWNPLDLLRRKTTPVHPKAQAIRDMAAGNIPDEKIPPDKQVMWNPQPQETEGAKMDKTIKARRKKKSIENSLLKLIKAGGDPTPSQGYQDEQNGHKNVRGREADLAAMARRESKRTSEQPLGGGPYPAYSGEEIKNSLLKLMKWAPYEDPDGEQALGGGGGKVPNLEDETLDISQPPHEDMRWLVDPAPDTGSSRVNPAVFPGDEAEVPSRKWSEHQAFNAPEDDETEQQFQSRRNIQNSLLKLMKQPGREDEIRPGKPGDTHLTGPIMHPEDKTQVHIVPGAQASLAGGTMESEPGGGKFNPVSRTQAMELPTQQEHEAWADEASKTFNNPWQSQEHNEAIRAKGGSAWKPQIYQNSIENALLKLMKEGTLTSWMPEGTPRDPRERPLGTFTQEERDQLAEADKKVRSKVRSEEFDGEGGKPGPVPAGQQRRREPPLQQSLMKEDKQRFNAMAKDKVKEVKEGEEPYILVADGDSKISPTKDSLENTLLKIMKEGTSGWYEQDKGLPPRPNKTTFNANEIAALERDEHVTFPKHPEGHPQAGQLTGQPPTSNYSIFGDSETDPASYAPSRTDPKTGEVVPIPGATPYHESTEEYLGEEFAIENSLLKLMKAEERPHNGEGKDFAGTELYKVPAQAKFRPAEEGETGELTDEEGNTLPYVQEGQAKYNEPDIQNTLLKLMKGKDFRDEQARQERVQVMDNPLGAYKHELHGVEGKWKGPQGGSNGNGDKAETSTVPYSYGTRGSLESDREYAGVPSKEEIKRQIPRIGMQNNIENSILKIMKYGSDIKPSEVGMTKQNSMQDMEKQGSGHESSTTQEAAKTGTQQGQEYWSAIGAIDAGVGLLGEGVGAAARGAANIGGAAARGVGRLFGRKPGATPPGETTPPEKTTQQSVESPFSDSSSGGNSANKPGPFEFPDTEPPIKQKVESPFDDSPKPRLPSNEELKRLKMEPKPLPGGGFSGPGISW